jgi:hypothetical protein
VFVVACVALVGWNAYAFVRNQRELDPADVIAPRSTAIDQLAAENPMVYVHSSATMYRLRRFAGKTIVISERRRWHRYLLERVARMKVEVTPDPLHVARAVSDRIVAERIQFSWDLDAGKPVGVVVADGADRYVLAERDDDQIFLLLPEAVYREVTK